MLQNLPIMFSGISFYLPIIPKVMFTAPIILQIMLIYCSYHSSYYSPNYAPIILQIVPVCIVWNQGTIKF